MSFKEIRLKSIVFLPMLVIFISQAQRVAPFPYATNSKINYVRTWEAKAPQNDESKIRANASIDSFIMTTQYLDGLGRPIQTVVKQYTPFGKDLVSPVVYDEMGREHYSYMPFAANNTGGNSSLTDGGFKLNPFQQDSSFSKAQYPGESYYYSQLFFENSPLSRQLESFAPGNSWVGTVGEVNSNNRRSVKTEYLVNTDSDSVRIWSVSSASSLVPTSSLKYAAGELYKIISIDEHLNKVVEYQDKEGKIILKKVQLSYSPGNAHMGWLCTYYIYDELANLRFVLQPRAIEFLLAAGNWTISNEIRDELCFYYGYDKRSRMVIKKVPGAGEVYLVYDSRGRLVMTQDSLLRASQKWMVNLYDDLNRPVQTGLANNSSIGSKNFSAHLTDASNSTAYPFNQWNLPISGYEMLTQSGYDHYDSIPSGGSNGTLATSHINSSNFFTTFNSAPEYAQPITKTLQTRGLATWSKVKVLESNSDYLFGTSIYDEKARLIQVKSTNISGGVDTLTSQYDFSGKLLRNHVAHSKAGTNAQRCYVLTKNSYDAGGRLTSISKRINKDNSSSTTDKLITEISYNELGQVKEKSIAPEYNSNAGLETLTYDYNIRGWILGANRDYAKSTSSTSHYFGFDLGYDKIILDGIGSYASAQYNGNIGGMLWKSAGDDELRKYDFSYDAVNRLTGADFNQYTSSSFNKTADLDYSVNNLTYDANGNILSMNQKGWKLSGSTTIDSLQYNYYDYSNKLKNVIDRSNDVNTKLGDFRASQLYMNTLSNYKTSSATDYSYDANGNMVKDKNKDMETFAGANGIEYNHLNLPRKITVKTSGFANKGSIEYVYDATGNKLKKITSEGAKITTILYLFGNYVNDTLQYLQHEEGRIRFRSDSNNFVYDYFLKDHLGNVRMVLTEEEKVDLYPAATMEDELVEDEEKIYSRLDTRTKDLPGNYPSDTYTDPNKFVARVVGAENKIGPAVTLKVMAGDKINIRVSSWYSLGVNTPSSDFGYIIEDLINVFSGQAASWGKVTSNQIDYNSEVLLEPMKNYLSEIESNISSNKPNGSVNWILFDERFNLVESGSGYDEVGTDEEFKIHVLNGIEMSKSGYLFVFVSNSDQTIPVYFDNLQVTHIRGPILEETHYYPFGLAMAGISTIAAEFGKPGNRLKYNGMEEQREEFEDGLGLEWLDYGARMYDAQIGRWLGIDILCDFMTTVSPYNYVLNNPTNLVDIDGMAPRGPGDRFTSADEAAADWLERYGLVGAKLPYEKSSVIYEFVENNVKYYSYTPAANGSRSTSPGVDHPIFKALVPAGATIVAQIHNHPEYVPKFRNERFSEDGIGVPRDESMIRNLANKYSFYLVTQGLELIVYRKKWGYTSKFYPPPTEKIGFWNTLLSKFISDPEFFGESNEDEKIVNQTQVNKLFTDSNTDMNYLNEKKQNIPPKVNIPKKSDPACIGCSGPKNSFPNDKKMLNSNKTGDL